MNAIAVVEPDRRADQDLPASVAFLRDGPPSLSERRADLKKLRSDVLARRSDTKRC